MDPTNPSDNPLLQIDGLPRFHAISPEHVTPAIDAILEQSRVEVAKLETVKDGADWQNFVRPVEDLEERLARVWSPVSHLNHVQDSPAMREAYEEALPKLTAFHTELAQNEHFFRAYQHIRNGPGFAALDGAQRRLIDNTLRDLKLSGVALPPEAKARFKAIQQELSQLGNRFGRNVLDATQGWWLHLTDEAGLSGLPASARTLAKHSAEEAGLPGWKITLDMPSYLPFMMHGDRRDLREQLYYAYVTRASDQGPRAGSHDNTSLITRILELRREMAQLLGYASFAEMSLVPKMAETPQQVLEFLRDLAHRTRPAAVRELDELKEFARTRFGIEDLQAWDIAYYSEKLRQEKYRFSDEDIRPYFPADRVFTGMFEVVSRLYGLSIREAQGVEVWDPKVRFFEIRDETGELRGQFYADLYVRSNKQGGAWMDDCISRRRIGDHVQAPVAYLVCNFTPPVGGKPALLTHHEVETLFHEFGHGLHHMLTLVDYFGVSGINGVAWDAVELPSQFMENWCWEREALDMIGGHYETGAKLPDELLQKMHNAKNFHSGLHMLRQIEFALFDMRLYSEFDPSGKSDVQVLLDEVRSEVTLMKPPAYNRFQNSFSHIFAGGYAAGYYSYKWAEVLSADAFSRFEEEGVFNRSTARAFMHDILERGGAADPMDLFISFRGRPPSIDALLRHSGLAA